MFVNLTATYDTEWDRGLTCKLLQLPLDRHMVHMIMEMVGNRSFPYYRKLQMEQVTTPEERRPPGIRSGAPSVQHLHL